MNTSDQNHDDHIRACQADVIARMTADPEACKRSYATTGEIGSGLTCHVSQGRFAAITDLGAAMGGGAEGPSPGFFARAAIVGCVGIGVKMLAVREGLVVDHVTVTVETSFDDAALVGLGMNPAGPLHTRVVIDIVSPDDPARIAEVVDRALSHDPWFLALRDAQDVEPVLNVGSTAQAVDAA